MSMYGIHTGNSNEHFLQSGRIVGQRKFEINSAKLAPRALACPQVL